MTVSFTSTADRRRPWPWRHGARAVPAALLIAVLCQPLHAAPPGTTAIPVSVQQTDDGWQLLRDGKPYFIRGAGGDGSMAMLAAAGANSLRVWDAEDIDDLLDEAHRLGLTVAVGIWLGHERHGFDYGDPAEVAAQLERVRRLVLRYRDHPAVLLWGLGNEMEGFADGDDARIWAAVNAAARLVKELDPHHPTMTVTAEIGGERVHYVHEISDAIDIHGINAYGGAASLPARLREAGASKPYIVTEFGPLGPWEMPKTAWGAPFEQDSSEKADFYRRSYEQGIAGNPGQALGSYAFLWGHKMEGTPTWFGMFLDDGAKLPTVDTMTELWSGNPPADRAPIISAFRLSGEAIVDPGDRVTVAVSASDPEGGTLTAQWALRPESGDYVTGGDFRPTPTPIAGVVESSDASGARIRMPDEPGPYRLSVIIRDPAGHAATANVPLLVRGEVRTRLPVVVYDDDLNGMPWVPSGWMGNVDGLSLDNVAVDNATSGSNALRLRYEGPFGWAGIAWQHPANNWGEQDGGFDLTGAGALTLWARGEYGGERIKIGVGLLGSDASFPDSGITSIDGIELTHEWQQYRIPLKRVDLSSIKTGFVITLNGRRSPVTVYLDDIRFVR